MRKKKEQQPCQVGDLVKAAICKGSDCPLWEVEDINPPHALLKRHSGSGDGLLLGWQKLENYEKVSSLSELYGPAAEDI